MSTGVPGREIGPWRLRGGGPIGESMATAFLAWLIEEPPTLVLMVKGEPLGFLDGGKDKGELVVGVENDFLLGSMMLCSSESVRSGVRLVLGAGGAEGGVKVSVG